MDKISLLAPKNAPQNFLLESLEDNIVTVAQGYAGVGKTLLALNYGLHALSYGVFDKIVYTRPDVGTDYQRGRGSLPGDLKDKCSPLVGPLEDNINVLMKILKTQGVVDYIRSKNLLDFVYLEDLRGRSFENTFVIFDETQNSTVGQMVTALTRIGHNSKIAVLGDPSQVDVYDLRGNNGLVNCMQKLRHTKNVGLITFEKQHIVRNSAVRVIAQKLLS